MTIMTRIAKDQTRKLDLHERLVDGEQDERNQRDARHPYVSNPSALGPTESPALSPVQSAMTPGLRASPL